MARTVKCSSCNGIGFFTTLHEQGCCAEECLCVTTQETCWACSGTGTIKIDFLGNEIRRSTEPEIYA